MNCSLRGTNTCTPCLLFGNTSTTAVAALTQQHTKQKSRRQHTSRPNRIRPAPCHSTLKRSYYVRGHHGPATFLERMHLCTPHQLAGVHRCFCNTLAHWQFLQQSQPTQNEAVTHRLLCRAVNQRKVRRKCTAENVRSSRRKRNAHLGSCMGHSPGGGGAKNT